MQRTRKHGKNRRIDRHGPAQRKESRRFFKAKQPRGKHRPQCKIQRAEQPHQQRSGQFAAQAPVNRLQIPSSRNLAADSLPRVDHHRLRGKREIEKAEGVCGKHKQQRKRGRLCERRPVERNLFPVHGRFPLNNKARQLIRIYRRPSVMRQQPSCGKAGMPAACSLLLSAMRSSWLTRRMGTPSTI